MANIFLTRKCNLKCLYCFADEFVNKTNEEFSLENFKIALNFIKTNKDEKLGLIGGEPTLHPNFAEILDILNSDNDIDNYVIFTNGLEIDKYIDKIINKKVQILINCNSPKDIGSKYEKLKSNINLLIQNEFYDFTLGINLYSSSFDYSYIFDLLDITGQNTLRFSTSLPNSTKEDDINALNTFFEFKPYLFEFFRNCYERDIIPTNDCNAIPSCILNSDEKELLIRMKILADKYKVANTLITSSTCSPVIDILPDLNAVRCFGLSKELKVSISKFKNIQTLRAYFYNKVDLYARLSFEKEECEDCSSRLYDKCGLCFTYKIKRSKKLKENIIKEIINKPLL